MISSDIIAFTKCAIAFHRLRSFLTALGIAIGVTAVVMLTSIGSGLNHYIMGEFSQFGANNLVIQPGKPNTVGMTPGIMNTQRPLTIEDAEALANIPDVLFTASNRLGSSELEANGGVRTTMVLGTSPNIFGLFQVKIEEGQLLPMDDDPTSPRALAVLGSTVYKDLYGNASAVGERIRLGGSRFRVVGVLEPKGDVLGFNMDDAIIIPTARALALYNSESLIEILVRYDKSASVDELTKNIKRLMLARHGVEDFNIISQQQMMETLSSVLEVITVAVAALGGISLFVGGVGIFTVMTIAVRERTQEIGLLRSIGSTRSQIQRLFLSESVVLASLGGLLGLAVGAGLVLLIGLLVPGLPVRLSVPYIVASLAVSVAIGLLAGVAPASHAARLDPLEALRTE